MGDSDIENIEPAVVEAEVGIVETESHEEGGVHVVDSAEVVEVSVPEAVVEAPVEPKPKVKKKKKKKKRGGGRPTKYTPDVVGKLEAAFNNGFNDQEASDYAGISRDTLYEWLGKYPKFSVRVQVAKSAPNKKAKKVLVENIEAGNYKVAQWWLEMKAKDEFSRRTEVTGKDGMPLDTGADDLKSIASGLSSLLIAEKKEEVIDNVPTECEGSSEAVSAEPLQE